MVAWSGKTRKGGKRGKKTKYSVLVDKKLTGTCGDEIVGTAKSFS